MGAAGYVSIYSEEEVRNRYRELYPYGNIDKDWWYLRTITVELDSKKWILDYHDNQGHHIGVYNSFWFDDEEAQSRILNVLKRCEVKIVEVWT